MNITKLFEICKTFADATFVSLVLDVYAMSDRFIDAIYDTLRGKVDIKLYNIAATADATDFDNKHEAIAQATDLEVNEHNKQFIEWMTGQYSTYTWPVDEFTRSLQLAVRWVDAHEDSEYNDVLCNLINNVFYDAVLDENGNVSFYAPAENIEAIGKLITSMM